VPSAAATVSGLRRQGSEVEGGLVAHTALFVGPLNNSHCHLVSSAQTDQPRSGVWELRQVTSTGMARTISMREVGALDATK